ncbi:hypothetical protein HID58_012382 [Brassica napus]|uniref:Uncharacterized protein n=1 Tax=Brassica napus TaxID=3708 RepID=A0ABQ8E0W3_BRANA|nr:hypothetical protein HID58_012382 [Brassica napus]
MSYSTILSHNSFLSLATNFQLNLEDTIFTSRMLVHGLLDASHT